MSISVVARGVILDLSEISSDQGPLTTLVLGDTQCGLHRGREYPIDELPTCEVTCRRELAAPALAALTPDQPVIVIGELHISMPLEQYGDRELVQLTIEAATVGVDLARIEMQTTEDRGCS